MDIPESGSVNLLLPEVIDRHFEEQKKPPRAIPTPLPEWNSLCRDEGGGLGLAYGWHVTIGGASGKGKSLLALNMASKAMKAGFGVGFLSFEMSRAQLATRLFAMATNTPVRDLERGSLKPNAEERVREGMAEIEQRGSFHTNETHLRDIHEALDLAQMWREEFGVRLLIVDYIQLAAPRDLKEYEAVGYTSDEVRRFAQQTESVTVGLCQFNRGTSGNRYESPVVEGLKSASNLEQDSDQVLLLDHSRYERDATNPELARTFALLGKNRHGRTGEIRVLWNYETLTVREGLPDEEHKWPDYGANP